MSYWYDFGVACDLQTDTPQEIIDVLKYLVGLESKEYTSPTKNSLPFDLESYRRNFVEYQPANQFPGIFGASLRQTWRNFLEGNSGNRNTFSFRCEMHEDQFGEESWTFITWLAPYTETGGIGYFYTSLRDIPTVIYFRGGKAEFYDIELKHIGTLG